MRSRALRLSLCSYFRRMNYLNANTPGFAQVQTCSIARPCISAKLHLPYGPTPYAAKLRITLGVFETQTCHPIKIDCTSRFILVALSIMRSAGKLAALAMFLCSRLPAQVSLGLPDRTQNRTPQHCTRHALPC